MLLCMPQQTCSRNDTIHIAGLRRVRHQLETLQEARHFSRLGPILATRLLYGAAVPHPAPSCHPKSLQCPPQAYPRTPGVC